MAMCVMAVVAVAPCQCFSPGGNQTTSPGRISSIGPSQRCARPQPAVTIRVWPSGCVCQAVRAPGSKVTLAPATRAGSAAWNNGSMRTVPVNQSAGPLPDGCEPGLLMSISASAPTDAGEQLIARLGPALGDIQGALDLIAGLRKRPAGRVRLLVSPLAAKTVVAPKLGQFARDYPDVVLDITTDENRVDLVAGHF